MKLPRRALFGRALLFGFVLLLLTSSDVGAKALECLGELQGPELNFPPAPSVPKLARCTDGDPACDTDGVVNGSCRFDIALCLNVADDECTSPGTKSYVIRNRPPGHRRHDADLQALQDAVDALDLPRTDRVCTDPVAVTVPLRVAGRSGRLGKGRIFRVKGMGTAITGARDADLLKLQCVPAPLPPGCWISRMDHLLQHAHKNATGLAALQDSWMLAHELGYERMLPPVVRCSLSGDTQVFSTALHGPDGLAAVSLVAAPSAPGSWAPVTIAGTAGIFDRTGGLGLGGLGGDSSTASMLDASEDTVRGFSVQGQQYSQRGRRRVPEGMMCDEPQLPECEAAFWQCADLGEAFAASTSSDVPGIGGSLRDGAAPCPATSASVDANARRDAVCEVSVGTAAMGDAVRLLRAMLLDGNRLRRCAQSMLNGGFLCGDFPDDPCAFAGRCALTADGPRCEPFGDWCTQCVSSTAVCGVSELTNARCSEPSCGDGTWTLTGADGRPGTADDEECETVSGDSVGCADAGCNPPGSLRECKCAVCGNGMREEGEKCDGEDLGGSQTCKDMGFAGGELRCKSDSPDACQAFDLSDCFGAVTTTTTTTTSTTTTTTTTSTTTTTTVPVCQSDLECNTVPQDADPDADCAWNRCRPTDPAADASGCVSAGGVGEQDGELDGSPCDDGIACTANDQCIVHPWYGTRTCKGTADDSLCSAFPPDDDPDADCAIARCLPGSDADQNGCQIVGGVGQKQGELDGSPCDDGIACTTDDQCHVHPLYGVRSCSGTPSCDDANECTADSCSLTTGACTFTPVSDSTPCAGGTCSAGVCTGG